MTRSASHPDRGDLVREVVAIADRRRRARDANSRLWRGAPIVAGAALILAAAGRWAGLSPVLPLAVLGLGLIGFAIDACMSRRSRAISDEMAARIDRDADLGGELRSATWFATRDSRNEWANFHLDRAADRARGVNWETLYADVSGRAVRIATPVIVIATLGLVLLPGPAPVQTVALPSSAMRPAQSDREALSDQEVLSGELYEQYEALLAGDTGTLLVRQQAPSSSETNQMLSRLSETRDREELKELAGALGDPGARPQQQLQELADRSRRAADMAGMSPEGREALERIAENLEEAADAEEADDLAQQALASEATAVAESNRTRAASGVEEGSIQSLKESAGGGDPSMLESAGSGGGGMTMMADSTDAAGNGGSGIAGGSSEDMPGAGKMPSLSALRQELIEASADTPGENMMTETRRKTEQGQATVSFTGSAAGTFERSRAVAAPAVPESRRSSVQGYFQRKQ